MESGTGRREAVFFCGLATSETRTNAWNLSVSKPSRKRWFPFPPPCVCPAVRVYRRGGREDALPRLSPREQYEAGKQAGMALKTIHSLVKASPDKTWEMYRWRKYERYLK
jgi:hypothetical protein